MTKANNAPCAIVSIGYYTNFMVPLSDLGKLMEMLSHYPAVDSTWVDHTKVFYKTEARLPTVEIVGSVLDRKPEDPKSEEKAA
jgi:hypothetical protein